jgi:hypothetical protein
LKNDKKRIKGRRSRNRGSTGRGGEKVGRIRRRKGQGVHK